MTTLHRRVTFHGTVDGDDIRGHIDLAYDSTHPLTAHLTFVEDDNTWHFARDVLARRIPGLHEVHVDADGIWTVLRLTSPQGIAVVRVIRAEVDAFLAATARMVPFGSERIDVDTELGRLLKRGVR